MAGQEMCASLELVLADGGFEGQAWQEKIYQKFGLEIEVIKRNGDDEGFELLPQRGIVERSFGWMNYYRRLSKDYEGHCHLSRSWMRHDRQDALHRGVRVVNKALDYSIRAQPLSAATRRRLR